MAKAVVHILSVESPMGELARFVLVTGCPLALILASRALPF